MPSLTPLNCGSPIPNNPDYRHGPGEFPKVAAALLTWNSASTVGQALEDLLAQDYPNMEIIVLDDVSRDDTVAIAKSYAKGLGTIQVRENDVNVGEWQNLRRAIEHSDADFIFWACPGDSWKKNYVTSLVNRMSTSPSAVGAQSSVLHIDEETRETIDAMMFTGPTIPDKLPYLRLAREILIKPRGGKDQRPHYSQIIVGLLDRSALLAALKSFDGIGPVLNERQVLCQLALTGRPMVSIPEPLILRERHNRPTTVRIPYNSSRKGSKNSWLYFVQAGTGILRSSLRSETVPLSHKFYVPLIVFGYILRNYRHLVYIRLVALLRLILPPKLYSLLHKIVWTFLHIVSGSSDVNPQNRR